MVDRFLFGKYKPKYEKWLIFNFNLKADITKILNNLQNKLNNLQNEFIVYYKEFFYFLH